MINPMTVTDWTFENFGPDFDEHVARHLPGYFDVQRLVALVAEHCVPNGGVVADLGCSTGQTARTIADRLSRRWLSFYLYDADPSMLAVAGEQMHAPERARPNALCHYHRVALPAPLEHDQASLTTMLWTLQFINPNSWVDILREARYCAAENGVLLVAAKTIQPDTRFQSVAESALDDYKQEAGVGAEERATKTKSLRGTQHAVSSEGYARAIRDAGWAKPVVLWRWHVWTVLAAYANGVDDA
jgi:tRNA (cmo5U34)-methyltransferase